MKVSVRSLMCDVGPVHDDVAGQDFKAAMPEWCRAGFGKKANRLTTVLERDGIYLRQRYTDSMHQKPVYADLCNLGMKTSFRRGKQLDISSLKNRLASRRIGKATNSTPRHFCSPKKTKTTIWSDNEFGRTKSVTA